jgi:hypothetical protein
MFIFAAMSSSSYFIFFAAALVPDVDESDARYDELKKG